MLNSTGQLDIKLAVTIVSAALEHGRNENMAPLSVAVLDNAGSIRCLQTENGCALLRPNIAIGKAWTCVGLGFSTRDMYQFFEERPKMNPAYYSFIGLADHRLVPAPGGVFILSEDKIIGAVGVSGDAPEKDEACAIAGITSADLQYKT